MAAQQTRMDAPPVRLGATPIHVSPEGFKTYRGVAAFGDVVLEYPEDGRNEFAPTDEALSPEAVATLIGKPFTLHHPEDLLDAGDPESVKAHAEGTVVAARADLKKQPPELVVDVMVWTAPAQQEIESGRVRDLSPGYMRDPEPAPAGAHYKGKRYDVVQRRRRYNHLSGVIVARGVTPDGRRARLDSDNARMDVMMRNVQKEIVRRLEAGEDALDVLASFGITVPSRSELAGQRHDDAPLPPSRDLARWRTDSLAPAPEGHPASSAAVHPYGPGVAAWRGWSEPEDRAWVAYWPRRDSEAALLFTRRADDGAVLGAPMTLPPRPYAHHETTGETMQELLDTTPADTSRADAEPGAADPAAAALAAFSPEAVEILKTLPEADLALLQRMAVQMQGEAAEQAIVAAGEGAALEAGEAEVEAEDATAPQTPQALTMDMVRAAIADEFARLSGAKKDATPPAPAMDGKVKDHSRLTPENAAALAAAAQPKAEPRVDAAEVARRAAAIVQADQRFVEHVNKAGQRCDSVKSANEAALALIKATSPKSAHASAERAVREGRRDDLLALFDAADEARRAGHVADQLGALAGVMGGGTNYAPSHTTFPDGAVTG